MRDPRLDTLASVLVRYSTAVRRGDLVGIAADPVAFPLVEAVYEAALRAGGHPIWLPRSNTLEETFYELADDHQLDFVSPLEIHAIEALDVRIGFWAETNTRAGGSADPARVARAAAARSSVNARFMQRAADHKLRWVGTCYPTQASAQEAEMSLRDFERFVFDAGMLHETDPISAWQRFYDSQQRLVEWLNTKQTVRYTAPPADGHDGTDLTVAVHDATWINCGGHENFPDGEVFAGPQAADGHVNYTFPAVYDGREVEGVRLQFKDGRVIDATARKNEDFLIAMLDQDAGARTLGEIAIGTNYNIKRFTKDTLFDEKIGGTFHAAVGAGYPESGSTNESGLHWDMVCDLRPRTTREGNIPGGEIHADGEPFHKDGKFLADFANIGG